MPINTRLTRPCVDALRSTPLDTVLRLTGATQHPRDKSKWVTSKGNISINGMKFFNWTQSIGRGGAIDLTMHLLDLNYTDALAWLASKAGHRTALPSTPQPTYARRPLVLPKRDDSGRTRVLRYLVR